MQTNRFKVEDALFFIALMVGAALRLVALGSAPLDDYEASLALVSLGLVNGEPVVLPGHPALILWMKALMALFDSANFTARLVPALAGSALIFVPWLLREKIGRRCALLLAFFVALDPGLVGVSRQVGSHALATSFLLLAVAFLWRGSSVWSGFFAGLVLLSGPSIWPAAIAMGAAVWVYRGWMPDAIPARNWLDWKKFFAFAGASFLLGGSLFFNEPRGLSAAASGLASYLQGWAPAVTIPAPRLIAALFAYELPVLIFGIIALVQAARTNDRFGQVIGIWWAASFVLFVAYPSRSVMDVVWLVLPLLVLSARQLSNLTDLEEGESLPVLGHAALTAGLMFYIVYSLLRIPPQSTPATGVITLYAIRLVVAVVMLLAVTGLVAWGWSIRSALKGLRWGAAAVFGIYWLAATFHAGGISRLPEAELLRSSAYVVDTRLLETTIKQIDEWRSNARQAMRMAVINFDRPSLRWLLRDRGEVLFTGAMAVDSLPEIVITATDDEVEQAGAYRGQELVWTKTPAWSLVAPSEWLDWLLFRTVAYEGMETQRLIVWVRTDAFPGGVQSAGGGEHLPAEDAPADEVPVQPDDLQ